MVSVLTSFIVGRVLGSIAQQDFRSSLSAFGHRQGRDRRCSPVTAPAAKVGFPMRSGLEKKLT